MKFSFLNFSRFCLYCFVFLIPFQIKTLVFGREVFMNGFFNPYLSHYIYLADIFLFFALLFFGISFVFSEKEVLKLKWNSQNNKLFYLISFFVFSYFLSIFSSIDRVNSLIYALRVFEFYLFFLVLTLGVIKKRDFLYVFVLSMIVPSLIGVFQFFLQSSVGLDFLGEENVSALMTGSAKVDVGNLKYLRAYGTFPHPNVFAGFLLFALYSCIYLWQMRRESFEKWILLILSFLFTFALLLTFSRVAILALLLGLGFYFFLIKIRIPRFFLFAIFAFFIVVILTPGLNDIVLSRLFFSDSFNFSERVMYFQIAISVFFENFFGVGAGNFTLAMSDFYEFKLTPWLFQPVHNIYLLILAEQGIVGFSFLLALLFVLFKNSLLKKKFLLLAILSSFLLIGFFDHYSLTSFQGVALFWFLLIIF